MYPSGQMSGSIYDPCVGFATPCCGGYGYGYNNYYYPPGPVTPYQHLYPSPHHYVAPHPVMPPYCHHSHYHPMPGTSAPATAPANCFVPSEACTPIQQQQPVWRPVAVPVPQSNFCCGHPNHLSYYGNPWSGGSGSDAKVSNELEDVKKVDGVSARPVLWSGGSNTSQPQLFWIPPQYASNLQQQGADKEPQDGKNVSQMIPLDLDNLSSLHNKDSIKPVTAGARKDFPFPIILMPSYSDNSKESTSKNRISEIEEKEQPSICNNAGSLNLLGNGDMLRTVPTEPVKISEPRSDSVSQGMQNQNEKVRVKDIPVKQAEEISDKKPSTNAAVKNRSRSVSPAKTSKLPPVCLRVEPLPRKKNGNGTTKPPSSPSHGRNAQQSAQTGNAVEDMNSKKKEVSESMTAHHKTDNSENVKVVEASSKEGPNNNPVSDETGNVKNRRENINEGKIMDSKKSAQPETRAGLEDCNDVKARQSISEETAAVRIQSAYRGYEERKWHSLQKLRQIGKVREQISSLKDRLQALENNADMSKDEFERQRLVLGETIMSHLLTLDTIQGLHQSIRDVRKSVARELINLQEKLDLLHAQRFGERGNVITHGKGDGADNSEVNGVPCNKTDEQDSSDMINAGDLQANKHEENECKNMTAIDESADKIEDLIENACADLHQEEVNADNALIEATQDVNQPMGDSPREGNVLLNLNNSNAADMKLISCPDEAEDSGKKNIEGIILEEQSVDGGNKSSVGELRFDHETTVNCSKIALDPQAIEMNQTVPEVKAELGEVISGEVAADFNEQVSKSGEEAKVEVCDETIEHVPNNVDMEPQQKTMGCDSEILDVQETNRVSTCASEENLHKLEDVNTLVPSPVDDKPEEASKIHIWEEHFTNESTNQSQESMRFCKLVGTVNNAASEIDVHDKPSGDTEGEASVVTDNEPSVAAPEAAGIDSIKGNEKSGAPLEDVNCLPDDDRISIDEHETPPRLSNVSRTSTGDADSIVLAEENDKLREAVKKLLESEKDQLAVITTLNERLRNLEKKLKKKRNRKLKLNKSSNKNHERYDQSMPLCSM